MDEQQNIQPPQATYATQVPQSVGAAPVSPSDGKSGNGKKVLEALLLIIIVIAAAAGGYYLGYSNKKNSASVVVTKPVEQATITTGTTSRDALNISIFMVTLPMSSPYNDLFYTPKTIAAGESATISSASLKKIGKCQDYGGDIGLITKVTKVDANIPAANQVTIAKSVYVWTPTQNTCTSDQALEEAYKASVTKNFANLKATQ